MVGGVRGDFSQTRIIAGLTEVTTDHPYQLKKHSHYEIITSSASVPQITNVQFPVSSFSDIISLYFNVLRKFRK